MMTVDEYIEKLEEYTECCGTCEFNFSGKCASGDEAENPYGHEVTNMENMCIGYKPSFDMLWKFRNKGR